MEIEKYIEKLIVDLKRKNITQTTVEFYIDKNRRVVQHSDMKVSFTLTSDLLNKQ